MSSTTNARAVTGWILRGLPFVAAFGLGLGAFILGAEVSERPGIGAAGFPTQVYYALALFVMAGVDLGMPSGGPPAAITMLWVAYFMAPAVTTAAVVEGIVRAVRPDWWVHRGMRGHIVVVGAGRYGGLAVDVLVNGGKRWPVLALDRRDAHADLPSNVRFRQCDITRPSVRRSLGLQRARGVLVLTDDDLLNLDLAAILHEEHPRLEGRIIAKVSDIGLMRTIHDRVPSMSRHVVNLHQLAVEHLVKTVLLTHFRATEPLDAVVIAGFGRFGQTVLEALQREAIDELCRAVLVDVEAERRARQFDEEVGFDRRLERTVVTTSFSDPGAWEPVFEVCERTGSAPLILVGSHDDELNLRTALWLRKRQPQARIVVRTFHSTAVSRQLAAGASLDVFGVADMVRASLGERIPEWFGRKR